MCHPGAPEMQLLKYFLKTDLVAWFLLAHHVILTAGGTMRIFYGMMHAIWGHLPQLCCDWKKIPVLPHGDAVTGTARATVICCLHL